MSLNFPFILVFLVSVVIVNFFINKSFRVYFLSFCSLLFLALFNLESCAVLVISSLLNFYLGTKIKTSKTSLIVGVLLNGIAIIIGNYFNFYHSSLAFSFVYFDIGKIIVALGLSFYSLQNISYLIEINRGSISPKTNRINYILYISFFPKIISGPILSPINFFPQIAKNNISQEQLVKGFQRIVFGLLKKMVLADRLVPSVNSVFDYSAQYSGLTTIVGIYLFTLQLYFDFSGYSDIAIGAANMLGYDLAENFKLPLNSTSISEFWRRWHISLINWFTTYIYYPTVYKFRKFKKAAALIGIVVTFFLSAIWHGIGFTFLFWALCHTIYLVFELFTKSIRKKLSEKIPNLIYHSFSVVIVFNLVCFSNIFFRASSLKSAFGLIQSVFSTHNFIPDNLLSKFIAPLAVGGHQSDKFNFYSTLFLIVTFLIFESRLIRISQSKKLNLFFVFSCILLIMLFGIFNNGMRFIYMQF